MAAANPNKLAPQAPEVPTGGPVIEYTSEKAKLVEFTVNPLATRYVVNENGIVVEYL